jgi:ATP-dependent DNA helicase RecQ
MLDYLSTAECRLVFLRRQLDDPDPTPCGRCDVCTGTVWSPEVSAEVSAAAAERLRKPGVEIAPRKMWPSGMKELGVPVSGRLKADELAETGRAVGRLSDIGWGTRLRELLAGPDQPVPADLLDAVVRVLAGWDWAQRPVGVVGIGSRTRPNQLEHLARRIAEIGRLPLLGMLPPAGERPGAHENSAQRLAAVWEGFDTAALPDLAGLDGPVLLVDDLVDSGWTLTVAARAVRRAGAPAVLPLALALAG